MKWLIDNSITPNPWKPEPGDTYGREPNRLSDGMPLRVVVLEFNMSNEGDWTILADGREEIVGNLPMYLASISGIEPLGRVRKEAP